MSQICCRIAHWVTLQNGQTSLWGSKKEKIVNGLKEDEKVARENP